MRLLFLLSLSLITLPLAAQQLRVPWTASKVQGTPEPPPPFAVERLWPGLTFTKPVDVTPLPGSARLVVVEQAGKLWSFLPGEGLSQAELLGDLREYDDEVRNSYAVTFHPRFAENRFIYTWANLDTKGQDGRDDGTKIVRFKVTDTEPPRIDFSTATFIISWRAGGHNGGNLRFGPDGMFYISTGDATAPDPPDGLATGQDLSDLLSSVLRIDVDHPSAGRAYSIPADNPFIMQPKARGEIWAYGLRNPWRMAFDSVTGDLFAGDVGWEQWEMIYRIERGGNYGWSLTEGGKQDIRPDGLRGPTPILPPIVAHSHDEAASITGGEFYHGKRLPELSGRYIYADWQMGTFWSLRAPGGKLAEHREIARSSLMPVGFGLDQQGELLIVDHSGGGLWQLVKNPHAGQPSNFPRKLSDTGLFADTAAQNPAPGVQPYLIHAPRWADHATAERWVAFPGTEGVKVAAGSKGVVLKGRWAFPAGAVLAKTYSLEMQRGESSSRKRIETQLLHFDGNLWGAYSYRWNDAQTDAELVPSKGAEASFDIADASAPGGRVSQRWRFFSRSECARCHTLMNDFVQGFSSHQLDRATAEAKGRQLDQLTALGLTPDEPRFADPHGQHGSLEVRARSYLHANCGICHRFNAGGNVPSYMNIDVALKEAHLLDALPVQGDLGLPEARVIASGDPARSVLLYRMTTAGRGHMPYLGARLVDDRGVKLIRDWIASMPNTLSQTSTATQERRQAESEALKALKRGELSQLDGLLISSSGAFAVALAVIDGSLKGAAREQAIAKGSALPDLLRRELFERFLPESQRRRVLGQDFDAAKLLAVKGESARGKAVFQALCIACHKAEGAGVDFGPDLTHIASKWATPEARLEQLLKPSQLVDAQWRMTTVTLKNKQVRAGFLLSRDERELKLKLPGGVVETLALEQVQSTQTSSLSPMPEGLLQGLTEQEAADLLSYLAGLK